MSVALIFSAIFLSSYTLIFFGPFMLAGKGRSRHGSETTMEIIQFTFEHQIIFIALCLLLGMLGVMIYWSLKRNKELIASVKFDEHHRQVIFERINFFNEKIQTITVSYDKLNIEIRKLMDGKRMERMRLCFYDGYQHIGNISSDDYIWENEIILFRELAAKCLEVFPDIRITKKQSFDSRTGNSFFKP